MLINRNVELYLEVLLLEFWNYFGFYEVKKRKGPDYPHYTQVT